MLVSIAEYAAKHGKKTGTIQKLVLYGRFQTAQKIGSIWVIDDGEPYPSDKRLCGTPQDLYKFVLTDYTGKIIDQLDDYTNISKGRKWAAGRGKTPDENGVLHDYTVTIYKNGDVLMTYKTH